MSSFVSKTYDKNNNRIDAKYTLFHYNTNKLSNEHTTDNQKISIDTDDADINNGGAAFTKGDVAIVHLWANNKCAVVRIVGDGSDSYSPDMQLLECQAPTTRLIVNDGRVETDVVAGNSSSDEYQWEYKGITHYHKASWYGKPLCDNVGIDKIEYDWGDGWVADNKHKFAAIGDYTVKVRATNKCGLKAEDSDEIRIRYRIPTITLNHAPDAVIVGSVVDLLVDVTDPDNRITGSKWFIDDEEIVVNSDYTMESLSSKTFKVVTYWNDGYEDLVIVNTHLIEMQNQPPTIDMSCEIGGELFNEWYLTSRASDPEGLLDYVEVKVYTSASKILDEETVGEEDWALLRTSRVSMDAVVTLYASGTYRVTMQAVDTGGKKSEIQECLYTLACPEGGFEENSNNGSNNNTHNDNGGTNNSNGRDTDSSSNTDSSNGGKDCSKIRYVMISEFIGSDVAEVINEASISDEAVSVDVEDYISSAEVEFEN